MNQLHLDMFASYRHNNYAKNSKDDPSYRDRDLPGTDSTRPVPEYSPFDNCEARFSLL